MLSDTVSRTIFWLWLVLGLMPSIVVVVAAFVSPSKHEAQHIAVLEQGEIFATHHAGIIAGPIRIQVFPRLWAGVAAIMGIVLLIFGLVFLLHTPTQTR
jgi:hypothetical protein